MAWSALFLSKLGSTAVTPRFRLERVRFNSEGGDSLTLWSDKGNLRIARVRVDGQELNPFSMAVTWGRTVVELIGQDLSEVRDSISRGTFVALYLGFEGDSDAQYERIAIGGVRSIRRNTGASWSLELLDVPASLRQRPTTDATAALLFYTIGVDVSNIASTVDYTAGLGSLTVSSTSGRAYLETGGSGALLVTPSGGDPFYVTFSSATGTVYTINGVSQMGTTDAAAAAGSDVLNVAYLAGHPITIALKVLTIGLGGANGAYDTYPTSWGLSLPVGLVDLSDAEKYRDKVMVVAAGSWGAQVVVGEAQTDAMSWLQGWLAQCGCYLAMRQGCVTVRAWQSSATPINTLTTNYAITDADVVSFESHQWWYESQDMEFYGTKFYSNGVTTSTSDSTVYHRPIGAWHEYDATGFVWSNGAAIGDDVVLRMRETGQRTPEYVNLRLRGYRWAELSVGDLVLLTSKVLVSRIDADGYDERRAVVVKVSATWGEAPITEVGLLVYPKSTERWA